MKRKVTRVASRSTGLPNSRACVYHINITEGNVPLALQLIFPKEMYH